MQCSVKHAVPIFVGFREVKVTFQVFSMHDSACSMRGRKAGVYTVTLMAKKS